MHNEFPRAKRAEAAALVTGCSVHAGVKREKTKGVCCSAFGTQPRNVRVLESAMVIQSSTESVRDVRGCRRNQNDRLEGRRGGIERGRVGKKDRVSKRKRERTKIEREDR